MFQNPTSEKINLKEILFKSSNPRKKKFQKNRNSSNNIKLPKLI